MRKGSFFEYTLKELTDLCEEFYAHLGVSGQIFYFFGCYANSHKRAICQVFQGQALLG